MFFYINEVFLKHFSIRYWPERALFMEKKLNKHFHKQYFPKSKLLFCFIETHVFNMRNKSKESYINPQLLGNILPNLYFQLRINVMSSEDLCIIQSMIVKIKEKQLSLYSTKYTFLTVFCVAVSNRKCH